MKSRPASSLWPRKRPLVAVLCFWMAVIVQATAQNEPVEAFPTLGEFARAGNEAYITVLASNPHGAQRTFNLSLNPDDDNPQRIPLVVESGATKRIDLLVPQSYYYGEVTLEWDKGRRRQISLRNAREEDRLLTIISPGQTEFGYLGGLDALKDSKVSPSSNNRELFINRPRLPHLPRRWSGYGSTDMVVCYELSRADLEEPDLVTMLDWVRCGGNLVLVSSGEPDEYRGTLLAGLAPLQGGESRVQGALTMLVADSVEGEVLLRHQGIPLLSRRRLGLGSIFQISTDVSELEPLGAKRAEKLWSRLDQSRSRIPQFRVQLLRNPTEIPKPDPSKLAWYLIAYAVLVGPVNLLLLRRKDRMLLAFVTIPAIALFFAGSSYLLNRVQRGQQLTLREEGWALMRSGESQLYMHSNLMLFTPTRRRFDLAFGPRVQAEHNQRSHDSVMPQVAQDHHKVFKDLSLGMWSLTHFDSSELVSVQGPIDFQILGDTLEVQNDSGLTLHSAVLVSSESRFPLAEIRPGKHSFKLEETKTPLEKLLLPQGDEDASEVLGTARIQFFPYKRPVLMAWVKDDLKVDLKVEGVQKHISRRMLMVGSGL